jgi:hypothetical protein
MGPRKLPELPPFDFSKVRDNSITALAMLAVCLGWNVLQKTGQPLQLMARDGHQLRLPTNTGVRIGVLQGYLSSIMTHTEAVERSLITPELVDELVDTFKLNREFERRLRDASGETVQQHRERTKAKVVEPEPEPINAPITVDHTLGPVPRPEVRHIVSRKPFQARYQATVKGAKLYQSKVSNELIWSDGTKEYECVICGHVFSTPKGAGSHHQKHVRAGEAKEAGAPGRGDLTGWTPEPAKPGSPHRVSRLTNEIRAALDAVPHARNNEEWAHAMAAWIISQRPDQSHHDESPEGMTPEQILNRIAVLVDRGRTVELMAQVDQLQHRVDDLIGERRALRDLLTEESTP